MVPGKRTNEAVSPENNTAHRSRRGTGCCIMGREPEVEMFIPARRAIKSLPKVGRRFPRRGCRASLISAQIKGEQLHIHSSTRRTAITETIVHGLPFNFAGGGWLPADAAAGPLCLLSDTEAARLDAGVDHSHRDAALCRGAAVPVVWH